MRSTHPSPPKPDSLDPHKNLLANNAFLSSFLKRLQRDDLLYLLSRTMDQNPVSIVIINPAGRIEYANATFARALKRPVESIPGKNISELRHFDLNPSLLHNIGATLKSGDTHQVEIIFSDNSNNLPWTSAVAKSIPSQDRAPEHFILFLAGSASSPAHEPVRGQISHHDPLTYLPNRVLFNLHLNAAIQDAQKRNSKIAVALLGLDRFKTVNNTFGHEVGDTLIRLVGRHLREILAPQDILARMGGDEFLLLFPNIESYRQASEKAKSIIASFAKPFSFTKRAWYVSASMGVSLYPEDGENPQLLLKNADAALQSAKQAGGNTSKFYTAKLNATAADQLDMETALRQAIKNKEFLLFYQPQVNVTTGHVVGLEALVRWNHPKQGLMLPDQFIPLAEATGVIIPLGQWVLQTACRQVLALHQGGFPALRMSVNLSARQFQEPELVESILGICQKSGLDPRFLEIEITENIFLKDLNITNMILQWLSKKGVSIAIDDFGTGYSSLTYLKRFPINTLKIDKSFIQDCLSNNDDAAIVATITSIAQNLNMLITAEGVEKHDQLHFLRNLGCDNFQGFLFSRPLSSEDITLLLNEGRTLQDIIQ